MTNRTDGSIAPVRSHTLAAMPLLAVTPMTIGVVFGVLLLFIAGYFLLTRTSGDEEIESEDRPEIDEAERPTTDLLEEREEFEEAEDDEYEEMSLAEIKKSKMAKSKGGRKGRETAGEATDRARERHGPEDADESADGEAFSDAEVDEEDAEAEVEESTDDEQRTETDGPEESDDEPDESPAVTTDADPEEETEDESEELEDDAKEEGEEAGEASEEDDEPTAEESPDTDDEEDESGLAVPDPGDVEASGDVDDDGGGLDLPSPGELSEVSDSEEESDDDIETSDESDEDEAEEEEVDEVEKEEVDEEVEEEEVDEEAEKEEIDEEAEEEADEDEAGDGEVDEDEAGDGEVDEDEAGDGEVDEDDAGNTGEEDDEKTPGGSDGGDDEPGESKSTGEGSVTSDEGEAEEGDAEASTDEKESSSEESRGGLPEDIDDENAEPKSFEKGLEKTREGFIDRLSNLFSGEELDDEMVEEVEEVLFSADIGPRVAQEILDAIEEQLSGDELEDPGKVWGFIRHYTKELLETHEEPLDPTSDQPFVALVVGVNGVGKTTTIGKMASRFKRAGMSVLLVAGDTFRAAAVEQLGIWADRTGVPMHTGDEGADPASVVYSGIERAVEEDIDVVLCDTSGRLHTDVNLMEELEKMERVAGNACEGAPHETHLVLDANTGQNAIQQAEKFNESLDVSGITLTKFDGTARGGVILGVCKRFEAPIRYVGIGERIVDLREFDADEFVEALFM